MTTVLIVEDDSKIAALLRDYLEADGHSTHYLANGSEVAQWVATRSPDAILLDIMLPGTDGLSVCREIRRTSVVPVILVTARIEEIDRILGLELGADDYVCKPFSPREVVARVNSILRRVKMSSATSNQASTEYHGIRIDVHKHTVTMHGVALDLTPVEFRLIKLLVATPGRVYSRSQLIDNVYIDGRIVSDRTIDSHVKNLRHKLADGGADEELIHSIYGVGYKIE